MQTSASVPLWFTLQRQLDCRQWADMWGLEIKVDGREALHEDNSRIQLPSFHDKKIVF